MAFGKRGTFLLLLIISQATAISLPENYESEVRPNNGGIADVINVSMNILSIRDVDEENQKLSVDFLLRTFWVDKRLANLVERETVFVDKLPEFWTPHLSIADTSEPPQKSGRAISLKYDGTLDYTERVSAQISCPISMLRYPFGRQSCQIQLNSNGYTTLHLVLIWNGIISPHNIHTYDPEYTLRQIDQSSERQKTISGEYSYINVDISLTRSPFRVIARAIVPTFVFATLSYFITFFMCIRPKSNSESAKINGLESTVVEEVDNASYKVQPAPSLTLSLILFDIVKVAVNAFILLIVVLVKQINFLKSPRSNTPTALDIWTGVMSLFIFICFVLSLQICFSEWKRVVSVEENSTEDNKVTLKVVRIFRVSIPVVFLIFLIAYVGFCLL